MELAAVLKEKRIEKGLSPEEVAMNLGISAETVQTWEAGQRPPMLTSLVKLSKLYGVPVDYFFEQDPTVAETITAEVRKSRSRYLWNILLVVALLVFAIGVFIASAEDKLNQGKNDDGLKPNDLYNQTFVLVEDTNGLQKQAILTFTQNELHVVRDYQNDDLEAKSSSKDIEEAKSDAEKNGAKFIDKRYPDIQVRVRGNDYIVDGLNYHEKFTKLGDGLVKDARGVIYQKAD